MHYTYTINCKRKKSIQNNVTWDGLCHSVYMVQTKH